MIRVIVDRGINPIHNLAIEHATTVLLKKQNFLMNVSFWQNSPSIILGRSQDIHKEVDLDICNSVNIPIYRRISAGGTVYQDEGNYNFSFIVPIGKSKLFNIKQTTQAFADYFSNLLIQTLQDVGFSQLTSTNGSIFWTGKKISGSAQYLHQGTLLHHCTLLVNSNLQRLERLLINKGNITYKHMSNYSSTKNLETLNISLFQQTLLNRISKPINAKQNEIPLTGQETELVEELATKLYSKKEWNYNRKRPKIVYPL